MTSSPKMIKLVTGTLAAYLEIREVDGGFALAYPNTVSWRNRLTELAGAFEARIPLFKLQVPQNPDGQALWIQITGPADSRDYLHEMLRNVKSDEVRALVWSVSIPGRALGRAKRWVRRATAPIRVLPDFLVIGAAKCGTTSFFDTLTEHPSITAPLRKELYFFDHAFHKGIGYYRSLFATRITKRLVERRCRTGFRTGEATPCYLFHPLVPRRVAQHLPDARLIVLLRNPVERAYSDYQMSVRLGVEKGSFEEAIRDEPQRVEGELTKMLADERYRSRNRQSYSYLGRGYYADQLQNWFACFPRDQLLILACEELFKAPFESYRRVMDHLGLPAWAPESVAKSNYAPYRAMAQDTRNRLVDHFAPHNQRLYELIGCKFDWD